MREGRCADHASVCSDIRIQAKYGLVRSCFDDLNSERLRLQIRCANPDEA